VGEWAILLTIIDGVKRFSKKGDFAPCQAPGGSPGGIMNRER
jgi:hypothetical protein